MTKVNVIQENYQIKEITITGHTNFAHKGQDVVCAGISSIVTGFFNAVTTMGHGNNVDMSLKEGKGYIKVIQPSDNVSLMLDTFIVQLKTIEKQFPNYITIIGDDRYAI